MELTKNQIRADIRYLENCKEYISIIIGCHGFKGFKDWGFWPYIGEKFAENGFISVNIKFFS